MERLSAHVRRARRRARQARKPGPAAKLDDTLSYGGDRTGIDGVYHSLCPVLDRDDPRRDAPAGGDPRGAALLLRERRPKPCSPCRGRQSLEMSTTSPWHAPHREKEGTSRAVVEGAGLLVDEQITAAIREETEVVRRATSRLASPRAGK